MIPARPAYVRAALDRAMADGLVHGWYCYSPDGRRRWVVEWCAPLSTRVYSTREAESVADALTVAAAREDAAHERV